MSVSLWLPPNIFMARLHEDVVILDVQADRYDCLVDAAGWLAIGADGALSVPDPVIARQLVEAGVASEVPTPSRAPIVPASRELTLADSPRRSDQIRAFLSLATGTAAFHGRSLAALVAQAGPDRGLSPPDESRLAALASAARAAAPFVPFEGECLQRAYLLRRLLTRAGHAPTWVFGVRTWPFGAHCWLQIDDLVIGDSLDRVRFYTPIMAA